MIAGCSLAVIGYIMLSFCARPLVHYEGWSVFGKTPSARVRY